MKALVSGGGGLIGSAVTRLLRERGHEVCSLRRDPAKKGRGDIVWNPSSPLDPNQITEFDAVVHLAGRPVATLWTEKSKSEIRSSRVTGTATVAEAVARAFVQNGRPRVLVCGSAIGYYGNRGNEELDEDSGPGLGFLAEVCRDWEAAARPAATAGVRVTHLRTSLVLDASGGALARMLPSFRVGLGGKLGTGRQWCSWISLRDAARAIGFTIENDRIHGALNLASQQAVTNAELTRTLGRVLHRPTLFTVPAFAMRLLGGEMAEEMLLASQRVIPKVLQGAGFGFEDATLEPALRNLLG